MVVEQPLEREQPPRNALRVVEAVDADEDLRGRPLRAQVSDLARRTSRACRRRSTIARASTPIGKTPSRTWRSPSQHAVDVHCRRRARAAATSRSAAGTPGVWKPIEVGAEQALEELVAPRQDAEHLRGRERDVQEEADARLGQALAQHRRHEHELVVVHPDQVAGLILRDDGIGEPLVHAAVDVPVAEVSGIWSRR